MESVANLPQPARNPKLDPRLKIPRAPAGLLPFFVEVMLHHDYIQYRHRKDGVKLDFFFKDNEPHNAFCRSL